MRRFVLTAGAAALAALAGCGEAPSNEQRPATKITNRYHDELMALPPQLQRIGVMRAIRDNGRRCKRVEAAGYQQDYMQMAMWVALCEDGRYWGVFIAPNGDTQVRECAHARQLELPQCRPLTVPPATESPTG